LVSFVVRELGGKEKILTKIGKGKKDSAGSQKKRVRISPLMWPRGQEEGVISIPVKLDRVKTGETSPLSDKKLVVYDAVLIKNLLSKIRSGKDRRTSSRFFPSIYNCFKSTRSFQPI
jgi:hypothetical protein